MTGEIVLHHYENSPFSEKVRLVLGLKRLAWRSVIVPSILPKPDVAALTGGYRRTPFLQIGADVYCDSALMCRVLDRLHPEPPLYPAATGGLDAVVAQWADTALFWSAVPFTLGAGGAPHVMKGLAPEALKAFGADRAAMNPNFRRGPLHDQAATLRTQLARVEAMLDDGRPYLLGALPSIADVAAAQSVWFMRLAPPVAATHLAAFPRVAAWYERVAAFGHGTGTPMTSGQAIERAATATGFAAARIDAEAGLAAGAEVGVTPVDYAFDEVRGSLVGLDDDEAVVERRDGRAGTVRVHFPRVGYHVKPVVQEKT